MNRREFGRLVGLAGFSYAAKGLLPTLTFPYAGLGKKKKYKQWVWTDADTNASTDDWKKQLEVMHKAGIDAVLLSVYNSRQAFYESKHLPVAKPVLEKVIPLAKDAGLEVHGWMWTMPCNVPEVIDKHPEWFVVNRLGQSAVNKPAYVSYYRFMCPSRPPVWEFVRKTVSELSEIDGLAGVHLDYVRYPDVILPVGLQPNYHIVQDREYPQYDYCYCSVCRHDFRKQTGVDPLKLKDPAADGAWNQFRYDRITHIVNDVLLPVVHKNKKLLTAAVFPNWKDVRQEWSQWKLDGAMPMLYAKFYDEGVKWIGEKTKEEVASQRYRAPVYSGLSVGQLDPADLARAIRTSYKSSSSGVSLFNAESMNEEKWKSFREAVEAGA